MMVSILWGVLYTYIDVWPPLYVGQNQDEHMLKFNIPELQTSHNRTSNCRTLGNTEPNPNRSEFVPPLFNTATCLYYVLQESWNSLRAWILACISREVYSGKIPWFPRQESYVMSSAKSSKLLLRTLWQTSGFRVCASTSALQGLIFSLVTLADELL